MAEESTIKVSTQPQLKVFTSFELCATPQGSRKQIYTTDNTEGDKTYKE